MLLFPAVPGLWRILQDPAQLSWACPAPREKCRAEGAQIHATPKPSSAFCVLTGIPLALPCCCGQTWEGFRCLQKFGGLQKKPLQIPTGNSQGGGISFLAVQSLLLIYFHTATWLLQAKMFELTVAHGMLPFPSVLSVELVPGCLGEEQLLSLAGIQCWGSQGFWSQGV